VTARRGQQRDIISGALVGKTAAEIKNLKLTRRSTFSVKRVIFCRNNLYIFD
jgi:hypothetical protein